LEEFGACWEGLEDPRTGNAALHDFHDLLMIALCTVLCGGQNATDMAEFAKAKEPFLREFLSLENGLPSHDTFSRLFRLLDPAKFGAAFQRFMAAFSRQCQGVVAIDGKVLRRSHHRAKGRSALLMVSAWGCEQRMVLGQIATDAKSNEITAVPKLLAMLSLRGTIVTTDALNCQRAIAQQIVDQGGDYALALKGNQGTLHDDVSLFLDDPACAGSATAQTVDADHGRIETRTATISNNVEWLQKQHDWPGLAAIAKVERIREGSKKTTHETAYYLLSTGLSGERFLEVVRSHWGVENRLHWRLDVVMNEDQQRNRSDNGPNNLAVLRHMALNVMQKDTTKGSLRGKIKRAGWDDRYLKALLALF
jgi:predicted transposase YbfD/YdcC